MGSVLRYTSLFSLPSFAAHLEALKERNNEDYYADELMASRWSKLL